MACWSNAVTKMTVTGGSRSDQPPGDLETGQPGHLDVEKHQVRAGSADGLQRLEAVAGLADDLDAAHLVEQVAQLVPRQLLVVDDDGAQVQVVRHWRAPRTTMSGISNGPWCRGR